jgi:hypothetical protein
MTRALFDELDSPIVPRPRSRYRSALVAGALAAGMTIAPDALVAQDPTPPTPPPPVPAAADNTGTHLVRPGDTLWEIARIYLGDPFLWPEIYRVNTAVIEDPHWIFPGEALTIPEGVGQPPVIVAEVPEEEPAQPVTPLTEQQTPTTVTFMPTEVSTGPTVFGQRLQRQRATPNLGAIQEQPRTAVRAGEFRAAPWVDRDGGPTRTGRVVSTTQIAGVAAASERNRYHHQERIYVLPPDGIVPARGDRFLTFRLGPELHGLGQVAVPTGIVEIEEAYTGDRVASVARIVRQFDEIKQHDGLVAMEPFDMEVGVYPVSTQTGISGHVAWIQEEPVLPTLQRYLVLDASSRDGIRLGDQVTLVRPERENPEGVILPEQEIAVAQVVRVTPFGVTAIIVDQTQPAIKVGTLARVTARMP